MPVLYKHNCYVLYIVILTWIVFTTVEIVLQEIVDDYKQRYILKCDVGYWDAFDQAVL